MCLGNLNSFRLKISVRDTKVSVRTVNHGDFKSSNSIFDSEVAGFVVQKLGDRKIASGTGTRVSIAFPLEIYNSRRNRRINNSPRDTRSSRNLDVSSGSPRCEYNREGNVSIDRHFDLDDAT